jgi:uncharacterized protein (TIGR02001 family)
MQRPKRLAACLLAAATLAAGGCALLAPPADPGRKDDTGSAASAAAEGNEPDSTAATPGEGDQSDSAAATPGDASADAAGAADSTNTGPGKDESPAAQTAPTAPPAASQQPAEQGEETATKEDDATPADVARSATAADAAPTEGDTAASETEEEKGEEPAEGTDAEQTAEGKGGRGGKDDAAKDDDSGPKLELTVAWVSDYVFRGVSLSNRLPAFQGSVDYSHPLIWGLSGNVGLWRSQVRFDTEQEFPPGQAPEPVPTITVRHENGIYGGVSGDLVAGWTWSAQLYSYSYPGFKNLDYVEKGITLARAFAELPGQPQLEISGATFRSVFFPGSDGKYLELNLKLALINEFSLAAHLGGSRFANQSTGGQNYVDRAITLSRPFGQFQFDLVATSTNTLQFGRLGSPALLLRVSRTF